MSAVSLRCVLNPGKNPTELAKTELHYFAITSTGEIQGDGDLGLKAVLTALTHDGIKEFILMTFRQFEELIAAAARKGSNALIADIKIQLDLFQGWLISVKGFGDRELIFHSAKEFQAYLINEYKIEPLLEVSEVDAPAATIPGL
ncbi:hypothetical protein LJR098_004210 [Rhizobium sp. LjRoot98]|uniref:hypothetical protein n=1 Tax=Rhizobium sp. LjRoot98 TaxID=3342345 RepID=UPI003ED0040E